MNKVWHKGLPFSASVAPYLRHMTLVEEHREALLRLQGVWDSLSLLGQMSGAATDIAETRSAFQSLTGTLLDSLARRLLTNATERMNGKARVAIDILVRNLFERTADVGFLASDGPLCAHAALPPDAPEQAASRQALQARFRDYVAKYSVYDDIVVLSPQGQVLARLDEQVTEPSCSEAWVQEALRSTDPYTERFGPTALMGGRPGLIYATPIKTPQGVAGLLCLSFRLGNEMQGVFRQLLGEDRRSVICLLDAQDRVLQSSDEWQVPPGACLAARDERLVFAGRSYLSVAASASGYEGYMGPPGWKARVLTPLEWAFDDEDAAGLSEQLRQLSAELDTRRLFDEELRGIPLEACRIQRNLSRSLWNGKLRNRVQAQGSAGQASFAVTLLNEVQRTGEQLRLLFEQAIGNLHHSALAAVFDSALFQARLAIDIMDRNLYERANDCRWWALDVRLQRALAAQTRPAGDAERTRAAAEAQAVLQRINGLYTVYSLLLVFDLEGRVVAVSDPAQGRHVGQTLQAPWVSQALALRDRERYVVSRHEACGLYTRSAGADGDRPTYVYATALQHEGQVVGGIAIVFDGEPQFSAMLRDALPPSAERETAQQALTDCAVGLFVTRDGRVVASTHERWPVGSVAPLRTEQLNLAAGGTLQCELALDGMVYAVGAALSGGYREYRRGQPASAEDVIALVMLPLGSRQPEAVEGALAQQFSPPPLRAGEQGLDVAAFSIGGQWVGLPAAALLEALERPRITALPNAPRALVGMLQHGAQMLPVLDLGLAMFGRACPAEDSPVIICRNERGQGLALRVEELGPVFSVGESQALPSPTRNGRERLVRGSTPGAMLTLIALSELWAQIGVASEAEELPELLPGMA